MEQNKSTGTFDTGLSSSEPQGSRLGQEPVALLCSGICGEGTAGQREPAPVRVEAHRPSDVWGRKVVSAWTRLRGCGMDRGVWAGCQFVPQVLGPHRAKGVKQPGLPAPATPGMLVTDTSVLNSSVFRK